MIYHDLHFDQYKKMDALNSSSLKTFMLSPMLLDYERKNPSGPTKAMKVGTMIHKWVLENHDFETDYAVVNDEDSDLLKKYKEGVPSLMNAVSVPKCRRNSKEYKGYIEQFPGKEIFFEEEYEEIVKATELFNYIGRREPLFLSEYEDLKTLELRIEGQNELTITFEHLGLKCKARLDSLVDSSIYDVKKSANSYNFERDVNNFHYYIQVGFYALAYRIEFGKDIEAFNFVVVPGNMPYNDTAIFPVDFEYIQWSINYVEQLMVKYKDCVDKGVWPRREGHIIYKPSWRI